MRSPRPANGVSSMDRVVWGLLLFTAASVLAASRFLTPSPTGVGTHEQLGLPPCGFLVWFGVPCPACGLTTAFAHLAHFDLFASLSANPMGLPLFVATLAFVPLALHAVVRGRSLLSFIDDIQGDKWALGFVVVTLVSWGARLLARAV